MGVGRSTLAPAAGDRRFTDPAWTANPLLRRIVQAHLAAAGTAEGLVADADLEWRDGERMRLLVENLVQALAPSNLPAASPAFWRALAASGGASVVRGARHLASDLATPPRVPSTVVPDAFEVGADLAVTPWRGGAAHAHVRAVAAPGRRPPRCAACRCWSSRRRSTSTTSSTWPPVAAWSSTWSPAASRSSSCPGYNPDARHRDWGADAYGRAILEALEATRRICRVDRSLLLGLCSGGILAAMTLAHLAAAGGQDRVAGFGLAVAVLDQARAGTAGAFLDERTARAAMAASAARGYLDGRALAEVFAWLRPGDLVWSYWVNNYLQGRTPSPFDILYWNADTTRMTAALHRDFLRLAADNALTRPGAAAMGGSPVDLAKVDTDAYVVAGVADHLCPWQSCYRSTQLLGGRSRFALSSSGHIASMVNPPGDGKASYRTAPDNPPDPADWLDRTATHRGSWWPDYVGWLERRGGGEHARPRRLGAAGLPPMEPAPGTYVLDR